MGATILYRYAPTTSDYAYKMANKLLNLAGFRPELNWNKFAVAFTEYGNLRDFANKILGIDQDDGRKLRAPKVLVVLTNQQQQPTKDDFELIEMLRDEGTDVVIFVDPNYTDPEHPNSLENTLSYYLRPLANITA